MSDLVTLTIFTFHYGLIKTNYAKEKILIWKEFTFHYGLIKTIKLHEFIRADNNLHSTMVLLKQIKEKVKERMHSKFTFHYGLIKTEVYEDNKHDIWVFTFHYGLIKTIPSDC